MIVLFLAFTVSAAAMIPDVRIDEQNLASAAHNNNRYAPDDSNNGIPLEELDLASLPDKGRTLFFYAIKVRNQREIDIMLRKGIVIELDKKLMRWLKMCPRGRESRTRVDLVKALLATWTQIDDGRDDDNRTLLHWAADGRHPELVPLLLAKGADIKAEDIDGYTPLGLALLTFKNRDFIRILVENGAGQSEGWSELHFAIEAGDSKQVSFFLEESPATVAVNIPDRNGFTPLFLAVLLNMPAAVEILCIGGADVNKVDAHGDSPLHYAIYKGLTGIVKILLRHGADVTYMTPGESFISRKILSVKHQTIEQCGPSYSALHVAILRCEFDMVPLLITQSIFFPDAEFLAAHQVSPISTTTDDIRWAWRLPDNYKIEINSTPSSRMRTLLWTLKQFRNLHRLPQDVCIHLLLLDGEIREDLLLAVLCRIKQGIKRNCLREYVVTTPLRLRPFIIEKVYNAMIRGFKMMIKTLPVEIVRNLEPEMVSVLEVMSLESNFGKTIHTKICNRLGF